MNKEMWATVCGYSGRYQISSFGNVRNAEKEKILSQCNDKRGYLVVTFSNNGEAKQYRIHLLVWDYFGDSKRDGRKLQVDHKDNNKKNNNISNLQLLTARQNTIKSISKRKLPTGVCFVSKINKYQAQAYHLGKVRWLGYFNNKEGAEQSYKNFIVAAEKK